MAVMMRKRHHGQLGNKNSHTGSVHEMSYWVDMVHEDVVHVSFSIFKLEFPLYL